MIHKSEQCITSEMVSRICSGDITAYEEFVREQWTTAVRTCCLILRNPHDAEETAKEKNLITYPDLIFEIEHNKITRIMLSNEQNRP
ncbi:MULTISPECIES: hypothetical protein [Pelotomaculum]|uniref:hypothetical protein n=1 Tax=Pelotomaculum TaxID=191373 RepID=UPI0010662D69|nr:MULTISPECIES: hypothetical protein [Pelotomaculum]